VVDLATGVRTATSVANWAWIIASASTRSAATLIGLTIRILIHFFLTLPSPSGRTELISKSELCKRKQ
jgi:hypothetical protein